MANYQEIAQAMKDGQVAGLQAAGVKVYERSYTVHEKTILLMVKEGNTKLIAATGEGALYNALEGTVEGNVKKCPLTHANRLVLNQYLDYTAPRAFGTKIATMGLGDRLGIA